MRLESQAKLEKEAKKRELKAQKKDEQTSHKVTVFKDERIKGSSGTSMQQSCDEMGSPIDTALVNNKRLKVFQKPLTMNMQLAEGQIPVVSSGLMPALSKEGQGLNLMNVVVTCDEGMSPVVENFSRSLHRRA